MEEHVKEVSRVTPKPPTPKPPVPSPPIPKVPPRVGQESASSASPAVESQPAQITNAEFISAVFNQVPQEAFPAVCIKTGDPTEGGWYAVRADLNMEKLSADKNNYLNCSSFHLDEAVNFNSRKTNFVAYHAVLLDDIGGKVDRKKLGGFELSWLIETSPGNFQGGIILAEPITDIDQAERLQKAILSAGFGDEGASGVSRWARLPMAINGKGKYKVDGQAFQCRLIEWRPEKRYTPDEIVKGLNLVLEEKKESPANQEAQDSRIPDGDEIFSPKATENPVLGALKAKGLYKKPLGAGIHDISCPWIHEHTDGIDSGTAYFEPTDEFPYGGFRCHHSHGDKYKIQELLAELGITPSQAMNRAVIRVVQGDIHRVVDVAERELSRQGKHYQAGGLIVSIAVDLSTKNSSIQPTNNAMLTRALAEAANWEKYDSRSKVWGRCDPPSRHVSVLMDSRVYRYLPPLSGLARQPYFRESDGELVMNAGYDKNSGLFGIFDQTEYELKEPTEDNAKEALQTLMDLLQEFRFASEADLAAALSAIFAAVVRPSLPHAPAYHVKAPASGSGKSYLCELISLFAGPAGSAKVSFPKTSDEATKVLLSLLLTNPAVIEFDDMDSDWIPHGVINRVLTAEHITDRILGVSKTATVTTRSVILGSGNNVGPVRDLMRRVLTISIDPRCTSPATITYRGKPLDRLKQERGKFVSAVLTIIQAWRKAGCPRANVEPIVTYNGDWSDYCRFPLLWLGLSDPATALLDQIKNDPDAENLGRLLAAWHKEFGSIPTTLRKALDRSVYCIDEQEDELFEAIREFPVEDRGRINRSKLGWVLKKNANRIVNGLKFEKAEADGRTAWRVVDVEADARKSGATS